MAEPDGKDPLASLSREEARQRTREYLVRHREQIQALGRSQ